MGDAADVFIGAIVGDDAAPSIGAELDWLKHLVVLHRTRAWLDR
jgi:hypothetical protein